MGFYIGLAKKGEDNKFEYIFDNLGKYERRKWSEASDAFGVLTESADCIDKTQSCSGPELYWRPKDFNKVKENLKKLKHNTEVFIKLTDELKKNKNVYIYADY